MEIFTISARRLSFFNFLRFIEKEKPDLIILCGDILNYANIHNLDRFLRKIHRRAKTRIVAVMGNHDFWIIRKNRKTGESWGLIAAYSKALSKYGDILLWDKPYIHDDFIIVGIPGWYDFSYAPFELGFRWEDFMRGSLGGEYWNDFRYVSFEKDPEEVTRIHLEKLREQLNKISPNRTTMVILHFIPLRNFLVYNGDPYHDYWNAYSGSSKLGDLVLSANVGISRVFFGHHSYKKLARKKLVVNNVVFESVDISKGIEAAVLMEIYLEWGVSCFSWC